jgi:DNA-directed RNA polymerase II subunit RPB1
MYRKDKIELHYGDVVVRHLTENDIVLLNRQPTLHKQSMMGHYVHVIDDPTYTSFRVNVGVTKPYNADYDGDTRTTKN